MRPRPERSPSRDGKALCRDQAICAASSTFRSPGSTASSNGGQKQYPEGRRRRVVRRSRGARPLRSSANPGSGKSTVARMVVGLLPPSGGDVTIDGVPMVGRASAQDRQTPAPPHPDDLSGPLRQPQSALEGRGHRRRADPRLPPARQRQGHPARGSANFCRSSACTRPTASSFRMNSPAGNASASPSHVRWRPMPSSSSATSRLRPSTSRCRRRSST